MLVTDFIREYGFFVIPIPYPPPESPDLGNAKKCDLEEFYSPSLFSPPKNQIKHILLEKFSPFPSLPSPPWLYLPQIKHTLKFQKNFSFVSRPLYFHRLLVITTNNYFYLLILITFEFELMVDNFFLINQHIKILRSTERYLSTKITERYLSTKIKY